MDDPDEPRFESLFINLLDKPIPANLERKILEEDLMNQPTHIQRQAGLLEVPWPGTEPPTEKQLGLMHMPLFLQCVAGSWSGVEMAGKVAIMKHCDYPLRYALREDLLDIIDWLPQVKGWLKGWQLEVNSGRCWHVSGRIGAMAAALEHVGFLLAAPGSVSDYYGNVLCPRAEIAADKPGSPGFVATAMGPRYRDWISAVG
jgi:hypothetical protein